ncbi:MAG: pitrilysin family protein [Bryobacteraceae bacterium]|jgi:zinc protease
MRLRTALAAPAIVLALSAAVFCQPLPQGVQKKASLAGITEYSFPNGLRVLLYPEGSSPSISVNVVYLVGSRNEGYGETGMAHLLEHMDFIETTTGRKIKEELVNHGASWNGTTDYDRTNYFETFTASDENLQWALGLEADRMIHVKQAKALLDKEMTVVRNEFERGENSASSILEERVMSTAYLWHNYGKSPIGSREDIEKVPIDRLAAFYRKYYQPDNAVVVIGGRIDPGKTLAMVAGTLGKIPKPARALDQTYTVEPVQDGERYVELRRVGNAQDVILGYHAPAAAHGDAVALQVMSGLMNGGGGRGGGGADGRLYKALIETKKAQSASMSFEQLHDPGMVLVSASLSMDQSIDEVRKILIDAIAGVVINPPTADEIDRVKTRSLRNLEQSMANTSSFITNGLTGPISQGDWRLGFLNHDRLKDVAPADVVRVAKLYFKASNRTVGVFIPDAQPDRTQVPAAPALGTLMAAYKTDFKISHAESFDATPANIESRVTRSKLTNGMKVAMLLKQTANNRISAVVELHFGDPATLAGTNAAAQFAGSLLMAGTKNMTRERIADELQKLNAQVTVSGGGGGGGGGRGGQGGGSLAGASASISAPDANFPAALQLAAEILKEPVFPADEFDRSKTARLRSLAEPPTEPAQLSQEALQRHLSPFAKTDVLYSPTREEQLEAVRKVTLDDAKKFYAQFYGADHGEFAIIGQFDKAAIQQLAEELFGKWNSSAPYQRLVAPFKAVEAIDRKIETPDKANAQFEAGMRLQMSDRDPDYPAMVLANYMFGGSITARIPNRIRNKEGLSYSVSAALSIPSEGDSALFSVMAIANPGNMPKVESCFKEELDKALKTGFTAEEVAAAKKAYADARLLARSQDQSLLALLASHEHLGRTFKWDGDIDDKIQALTPAQIDAAFRKRINAAGISIVKAGDFKAAAVFQ